jgi:hypothetical protein
MKIRQVGAELFHTDGRTDGRTEERIGQACRHAGRQAGRQADMTKLIVAFRNFANAPKNWLHKECDMYGVTSFSTTGLRMKFEMGGSHSGGAEDSSLLGYDAMLLGIFRSFEGS